MGTPARTNILLELKLDLESITVANGYNTEVTTVQETILSRDEAREIGAAPVICFGPGNETIEHYAFDNMRIRLPITILGYVEETNVTTRSAKINNLIDDIIAAVNVDPTLNSNATLINITRIATDEADPDANPSTGSGGGTAIVEIEVVYHRTTDAS